MGASLTATGGRRRVGEKIGRSSEAVNDAKEIAHKGFPRPIRACFVPLSGKSALEGTLAVAI